MIFVSVNKGQFVISNHDGTNRVFDFTDQGQEELANTLHEWDALEEIMTDYSLAFSVEYGAPKDLCVEEWLESAMGMAGKLTGLEKQLMTFEVGQLEEMLQQLRDGNIDEVCAALNTWIAQAREE